MSESTEALPGLGGPARDEGSSANASGALRSRPDRGRRGPVARVRGIGTFYRQVVAELRKVIWPTRKELITYTSVVLVFVMVMVLVVAAFDFAFGKAVISVFGQ